MKVTPDDYGRRCQFDHIIMRKNNINSFRRKNIFNRLSCTARDLYILGRKIVTDI